MTRDLEKDSITPRVFLTKVHNLNQVTRQCETDSRQEKSYKKKTQKTAGLGSSEMAGSAKTTHKGKKDLEMVITLSEGSQRQSSITDMLNLTWYKRTDLQNRNRLTDCKNKLWLPGGEVGRDKLKV